MTFTTRHLSVGDILLLADPQRAAVYCAKLTFYKNDTADDPKSFGVVKSWVISDGTEIETVTR